MLPFAGTTLTALGVTGSASTPLTTLWVTRGVGTTLTTLGVTRGAGTTLTTLGVTRGIGTTLTTLGVTRGVYTTLTTFWVTRGVYTTLTTFWVTRGAGTTLTTLGVTRSAGTTLTTLGETCGAEGTTPTTTSTLLGATDAARNCTLTNLGVVGARARVPTGGVSGLAQGPLGDATALRDDAVAPVHVLLGQGQQLAVAVRAVGGRGVGGREDRRRPPGGVARVAGQAAVQHRALLLEVLHEVFDVILDAAVHKQRVVAGAAPRLFAFRTGQHGHGGGVRIWDCLLFGELVEGRCSCCVCWRV